MTMMTTGRSERRGSAAQEARELSRYPIYTTIPVTDLERAREWYQEMLGLEPSTHSPLEESSEGVFFDAGGGTKLVLFPTRASAGAGHTIAEFAVGDDIDEVIEALRRRGVVFEEYDLPGLKTENGIAQVQDEKGRGAHRVGWFKDCDGNFIAIGSYGGRVEGAVEEEP